MIESVMEDVSKNKEQDRKSEILDAALELFVEKGYHETTILDIANAAGLTKGGVYHYLKSKDEILYLLHDRFIDEGLRRLKKIESEPIPPKEKFLKLLKAHLNIIHEYKDDITFFFKEFDKLPKDKYEIVKKKRDEYENIFVKVLEEGRVQGVFDVENSRIAIFYILGSSNFMYQWYDPNGELSLDKLERIYLNIITNGILNNA